MAHNTSLRTFTFGQLDLYDGPAAIQTTWIFEIMAQITSQSMERLTLRVCMKDANQIMVLDLPRIASLFSGRNTTFAQASLMFSIWGAVEGKEVRAMIQQRFCNLDAQGRLEFHPPHRFV